MKWLSLTNKSKKKNSIQLCKPQPTEEIDLKEKLLETHMRILSETGNLLAETTNASTFFARYEDFLAAADRLAAYAETYGLPNSGKVRDDMEKAIQIMEDEQWKTTLIIRFLDRAVAAGKGKLLQQELWKYAHLMTVDAMTYWTATMGPVHVPYENREGEYMVCWVSFEEGGKTYCYLSDDPGLQAGDEVVAPVGNYGKEALAKIENIAYYDTESPNDFPFPLSKMKRIIRKI